MENKLTDCLFSSVLGHDPRLKISHDFDRDLYIVKHDEKNFMPSYGVTDEFIWDGGIDKFNVLTSQQQILIANEFDYCKKILKKTPILVSDEKESNENFVYLTVQTFMNASVDNSLKFDSVLVAINALSQHIGTGIEIRIPPIFLVENKIASFVELAAILEELKADKMIKFRSETNWDFLVSLTAKGAKHIKTQNSAKSKKVFIASQFNWSKKNDETLNDTVFEKFIVAIKDACSRCGYEADLVNQNHTNYITDEIIRGIRESRFLISDFTFNNSGVYFESGFARGLNKIVIHTVHKDHVKNLHFDIKQINYIEWTDSNIEQLKSDLINRIKALNI